MIDRMDKRNESTKLRSSHYNTIVIQWLVKCILRRPNYISKVIKSILVSFFCYGEMQLKMGAEYEFGARRRWYLFECHGSGKGEKVHDEQRQYMQTHSQNFADLRWPRIYIYITYTAYSNAEIQTQRSIWKLQNETKFQRMFLLNVHQCH